MALSHRTYRGHNWCYISEVSYCKDAERSRKFPVLKWSHSACQPEFPPEATVVVRQPPRDIGSVIRPRGAIPQTNEDDCDNGKTDDVIEVAEEEEEEEEVI